MEYCYKDQLGKVDDCPIIANSETVAVWKSLKG